MKIEEVPTFPGLGISSERHIAALRSAPKHFSKDRVQRATLLSGLTVEFAIESGPDEPEAEDLPEERLVMINGFMMTKEGWAPIIDLLKVQDVLTKYHATPQSANGFPPLYALVAQGVACLTHFVSDERLAQVAKAGFPILIIGSKQDILIPPENSVALIERLTGDHVQTLFFETGGHGAFFQFAEEIADGLARTIARAKL
jgi:pimeloyl-ACP methyl ester carboxylesterase